MPASRGAKDPFDDPTATLARGAEPPRPLAAVIRFVSKDGKTSTFPLRAGICRLGSAPPCDIVIPATTVSRVHAELELVPEGVRVTDLGSRNGIYYLGQRIERMILGLGARIEVGGIPVAIDADAATLTDEIAFGDSGYRTMIGAAPAMRRIFGMLRRLEGSLVSVLIEGESGVGKELIARALHEGSAVRGGPLVVVNCGAFAKDLVASELFGHRKGAFTGALEARRGAFETADGGTLFLDEIGELPLDVQPILLRALECGEIRAVGDDQVRRVKVRLIAATNRDLAEETRLGRFREDLFYRLAVVRIRVPPLRERREDVPLLAQQFARQLGLPELPPDVLEQLAARTWRGNARELRNAVQAYAALGVLPDDSIPQAAVLEHALGMFLDVSRPFIDQKEELTERFTRLYLQALLEHAGGNQSLAARAAGLDRGYLRRLLTKHGLIKP